ncbi:NnrS family protein [Enterovibrio paralichthyis]|uniref:NnrS family protein n=1 Tax=Enterovibrio paralichthyis TaxID=2853805 RepID=UPI001C495E41|nr:NnrS family protein [Enterovibrio paralichthyis]MBV7297017.1 NnrS family protein [Enterovibrio paralichthyis]
MLNIVDKAREERIPPIFRLGFRPFFLLASSYAVFAVSMWVWIFTTGASTSLSVPPLWWHAHEMLFGFAIAVVAGFLLTAVQTWTGVKGTSGIRLALVAALWLLPRILFWTDTPLSVIALIDGAFLLVVGWEVGFRVVKAKRWRNLFFIPMLAVALIANFASYATVKGMPPFSANALWQAMLWWFMLLISVMGGRVIPFFTAKRFQLDVKKSLLWLDIAANLPLVLFAVLSFFPLLDKQISLVLLWVGGVAQLIRLIRWQGYKSASEPLVWSLHLFYLALPVGMFAKALSIGSAWTSHTLIHLFAMGALAGVILAMISRVTMGHTGRAIYQGPRFWYAFLLLAMATIVRVVGPIFWPQLLGTWVVIAAVGWGISFGAFVVVFGPMLCKARPDGHPG